MKRILALMLALLLVAACIPTAVFAEETESTGIRIKYDILGAIKELGAKWEAGAGPKPTKTPLTELDYELSDGTVVLAKNNATGDLYRVDVEASFDVQGKTDGNGSLLLGGNRYVALNKEIEIYSKYVTYNVVVTGITKAQ